MSKIVKNNVDYIGSTYQSLPAESGGTATSLVTTGEKYLWNNIASTGTRVFLIQPTPPYSKGDLWTTEDNIACCITDKASGSFDEDDWENAVTTITPAVLDERLAEVSEVITGNANGTVILRLDADGNPNEILVTNNPDINATTTKVWRFNGTSGFGFSSTGYGGQYTTIIDSNGHGVADFLTSGTLNAAQVTIANFTAAMINGGKLVRGGLNDQFGTIELQNEQGDVIALMNNLGVKFYGSGSGNARPYVRFDNNVFFAGYDANNTQLFRVVGDEFRIKNCIVQDKLRIGDKIDFIPITITNSSDIVVNDGIALVGVVGT
jgi:hypothetical protein